MSLLFLHGFPCLPSFFLGYNGGNLQYGSPSFYLSKEISLQTHVLPVIAIFGWAARVLGSYGQTARQKKNSTTQRPARPKRHAKSMLEKTSSRNFEIEWATWRDYFCGKRHIKQIRIK